MCKCSDLYPTFTDFHVAVEGASVLQCHSLLSYGMKSIFSLLQHSVVHSNYFYYP